MLEEAEIGEWGECVDFGGVLAEELDGTDAVGVEFVVDVESQVVADSVGGDWETGCPLLDEVFDVSEAVVAGEGEVLDELCRGSVGAWQ